MRTQSGQIKCYEKSTDRKKYEDAVQACKDKGQILAEPKSPQELEFIVNKFGTGQSVWLGINDKAVEGRSDFFVWALNMLNTLTFDTFRFVFQSDNSKLSYDYWYPNEPNNYYGNDNCVDIMSGTRIPWVLNDAPCTYNLAFICQSNN